MRHFARIAPIAILLILTAVSASAQEITPAILPAETSFVVFSHSSAQIRAAAPSNPMVQAWYGPQSTQVRRLLLQFVVNKMDPKSNGQKYNLTPENADRLLSILENSFVVGMSKGPDFMTLAAQASGPPQANALGMLGIFFILDMTGKEAQFNLLWPAVVAALPKEIAHTQYSFGGVSVEKFKGPNSSTFAARIGTHFVWSTQQKVTEDLIGRLSSGAPSGNSLAENPDFQHCSAHPAPGSVMDAFFRFPDLSKIPIPANPQYDIGASIQSLHLDSLHGFCGNITMTHDGELARYTFLGDTTPGNLLSWFGSNRAKFETLALVPPSAISVSVGTFDLQALYKMLKSAVAAAMPGRQQASADLVEGMVSMQLGMPLTDALSVFRGEFATIKFTTQSSGTHQVFALTVANPDRILDLLHKFAPTDISGESQENGVTYFKMGMAIPSAISSQPQSPDSFVALSPQLLLVSSDKQALRDFMAHAGSPAGGASLFDNPDIRHLRATFPAEVLGLSVTDYTSAEWQKSMTDAFAMIGTQDKSKVTPEETQLMESLKRIPWLAFMGGFHWGVGAWWRDTDGIHFESRIQ